MFTENTCKHSELNYFFSIILPGAGPDSQRDPVFDDARPSIALGRTLAVRTVFVFFSLPGIFFLVVFFLLYRRIWDFVAGPRDTYSSGSHRFRSPRTLRISPYWHHGNSSVVTAMPLRFKSRARYWTLNLILSFYPGNTTIFLWVRGRIRRRRSRRLHIGVVGSLWFVFLCRTVEAAVVGELDKKRKETEKKQKP